jgi:hypothetical protein
MENGDQLLFFCKLFSGIRDTRVLHSTIMPRKLEKSYSCAKNTTKKMLISTFESCSNLGPDMS